MIRLVHGKGTTDWTTIPQHETEVENFDLPSVHTMREGVDKTCPEAVDLHTALKIPLV